MVVVPLQPEREYANMLYGGRYKECPAVCLLTALQTPEAINHWITYFLFVTKRSFPEGLPGSPVEPIRYPVICLELFKWLEMIVEVGATI